MAISTLTELSKQFKSLTATGKRWLFRGQKDDSHLAPTLERALQRFKLPISDVGTWENRLLREFKRHFHRYALYRPDENDTVEWLTIMQHHGAPTRLLDWTYSPQVALFFAVEAVSPGATCVVWAVENEFLDKETRGRLSPYLKSLWDDTQNNRDKCAELQNAVVHTEADYIVPLNPFRLSERHAVQQGAFLASQSNTKSFHKVFEIMRAKNPHAFRKLEIACSREFLVQVYGELRGMNISRVSLFPGLDGFSRSLENLLLHPTLWSCLK